MDGWANYECAGLVNANSGKTFAAAVEVARAVTGQDPHHKFPAGNGRFFCVGKDMRHLGQVMYKKLFRPEMKIIRDEKTKAWRAFRPWEQSDADRADQAKRAAPLIPERLIADIGWENKKENVPSVVKLINGWELVFLSSLGKPPQGSDLDGVWLDEEIVDPDWVPEMIARLLDRRGLLIWSATPQAGTDQLYDLHERADRDLALPEGKRQVEEFRFLLADNPHIDDEQKAKFAANLSADDYRVRVEGEFAVLSYRVYPEFSVSTHSIDQFDVPHDWSVYCYIDPGYQVCAVLFCAVPPPGTPYGEMLLLYDELYIRGANAVTFAQSMQSKLRGRKATAFLMDAHMAVHSELGTGKTVMQQYSEQLAALKVASEQTGSGFRLTSDDVDGGILAVHNLLRVREDGRPRLRFFKETMPNFLHEIKRYHRKRVGGVVTDKPDQKRDNHLMDCYDAETEVLTARGWLRFHEVAGHDLLATVNLETDAIEYQAPTELTARRHTGEMVKFGGHKLDALVTPGHRMVVYPKRGYAGYSGGAPVVKQAKDVTVWDSVKLHASWAGTDRDTVTFPAAGKYGATAMDAGDYASLLGWYVAEGSCARTIRMPGHGYLVMISQVKEEGRAKIRDLVRRTPWLWHENKVGFYTSCKQLWLEVFDLGCQEDRRVPDWIRWASPRLIGRFLEGAIDGDGWRQGGKATYATVSRRLADDVQELFIKAGRSASVRVREGQPYNIKGRRGGNCRDQFWVTEWVCHVGGLRNKDNRPNFGVTHYDGVVYCATVPNGTLIVRRNGKPMVCGNCIRYLAMHDPQWAPPRKVKQTVTGALAAFREKVAKRNEGEVRPWAKFGR